MRRSKQLLDQRIDHLLAGTPDHGVLAEFVGRLRTSVPAMSSSPTLVARLAGESWSSLDSVTALTRNRAVRPLPSKWRRRIMLSTFLSTLTGKLLVGSVALASTGTGLAATGNLPEPAQAWAQERFNAIGLTIPGPADNAVTTAVFNGNPVEDGEGFGKNVAGVGSQGESTKGLETGESAESNAGAADEQISDEGADHSSGYRP